MVRRVPVGEVCVRVRILAVAAAAWAFLGFPAGEKSVSAQPPPRPPAAPVYPGYGVWTYSVPVPPPPITPAFTPAPGYGVLAPPTPVRQPRAFFVWAEAEPEKGTAPLTVKLRADVDGDIDDVVYTWDFGDGSPPSERKNPQHVYERPGRYRANVKAAESDEVSDEDWVDIQVAAPDAEPPAR